MPDPISIIPPAVPTYVAYRVGSAPTIDGSLDDPAWRLAPQSARFVDIEGPRRPDPSLATHVRLVWDDSCLYVGAELADPDLWGTITTRDAVIFQDNDFEIFVDPDGDTHDYVEIEINALGTVWDLRLPRPYRDGGRARTEWDATGLRSAVRLGGTLNDPSDRDEGWTVELAIPWVAFEVAPPPDGAEWRVNFSRVHWTLDAVAGGYRKRADPVTGRPIAEANWVWSPQYAVNMHMPEMWGRLRFSSASTAAGTEWPAPVDDATRWALRRVYYAQRERGRPAVRLDQLGIAGLPPAVILTDTASAWVASAPATGGGRWRIRADGRIWKE